MALTREQLREAGILLIGPVVPEWFKRTSDGCSVPGLLKWILLSDMWRARCVVHDYEYYLTAILYEPSQHDRSFDRSRERADNHLRANLAKCSKYATLHPVLEWIGKARSLMSGVYFMGVRWGGELAIKTRRDDLAVPPTMNDLTRVRKDCIAWAGHLTKRAENILGYWETQLSEQGET